MKRPLALSLLACLLLLAACAPAARRSFPRYDAGNDAILQKIIAVAETIQPDAFHKPFKVSKQSDLSVTLVSPDASGSMAFLASPPSQINFELQPRSDGVIVVASGSGAGASDAINEIYAALDKAFTRGSE